MKTSPITQRAKSSPFKAMPIPPELIKTLASSVISDMGSGSGKAVKEEEEEPTTKVVSQKEEKPKTFAQSLVSGIDSGRNR